MKIYVRIIDEPVTVFRPVCAEERDSGVFFINYQPYDHEIERWEFEPGDEVICERKFISNSDKSEEVFVATSIFKNRAT